ncbi:MAG: hypothetical protein AB1830_15495 [Pseudomonadota bacterium]
MKQAAAFALVRGANDVASAVALALARTGFAVLLVEAPAPAICRCGQSFANAAFDGAATLEGVTALLIDDPAAWARSATAGVIAMTVRPLEDFVAFFEASLWVDGRMRKRAVPEDQRGRAPLVIGLGPNFIAGEPKPIGGYGRERYVYAPRAGVFRTRHRIGQAVAEGEIVARIDALPIAAPKSGILRGLIHDGVRVEPGTKSVEVVPAGASVFGVSERAAAIACGVIAALRLRGCLPAA